MASIEVAKKVGEHGLVLGIDYSKPMLEQAVKKVKASNLHNMNFVLADAHKLPIMDNYFDAATSCFTFAFLSNPQKAAKEMVRVVRNYGKVAPARALCFGFWQFLFLQVSQCEVLSLSEICN